MAIPTRQVSLLRFRWKLSEVPTKPEMVSPFTLRTAGEDDYEEARHLIHSAYGLDPEWSGCKTHIDGFILDGVKRVFEEDEPTCILVQHGKRVIAASAYEVEPAGGIHLLSGPCVQTEYRNRGIGGALLAATLAALRGRGLTEALGQTRPNTPSAKFLLTKFGGQPSPVEVPAIAAKVAAAA
ncbi:MAG: GNAT family N-acetyltransferase [Chthoniobacterales bacterium]|jgi:ribosomal protein S18 acetylase RimI-like enzyme